MARPSAIRTEEIVDAARRLFLEHGFSLSTAAIAKDLGISEGTIFKRFETKEALFFEALGLPDPGFARAWPLRAGTGEVRDNLVGIGRELLGFFQRLVPRVIMLCSKPGCSPFDTLQTQREPPPVVIAGALTGYLRAELERGRVGAVEPEVAARLFIGALHNFAFFEALRLETFSGRDPDLWISEAVDILWRGIRP